MLEPPAVAVITRLFVTMLMIAVGVRVVMAMIVGMFAMAVSMIVIGRVRTELHCRVAVRMSGRCRR